MTEAGNIQHCRQVVEKGVNKLREEAEVENPKGGGKYFQPCHQVVAKKPGKKCTEKTEVETVQGNF